MDYITLLRQGAGIAGAAAGAAVGSLTGPEGSMAGASLGAAAGEACKTVLDDLALRFLSPREQQRVAAVAALSVDQIREALLWREMRNDDFFSDADGRPSPAEEVFEGVLLAAKQEHEELKLTYLANFYSNLVFDTSINKSEANYLLSIAENLTYRQFCLLALMDQINSFTAREVPWSKQSPPGPESHSISVEALAMYQKSLVGSFSLKGEMGSANVYHPGLVIPAYSMITGTGIKLNALLGLSAIPRAELELLAKAW